ncbi:hypothetical protein EW146_g10223 [Bondarzewia mesenterica]|uniref:Chromo domain-containing protein n=1 Tax=Bondarzewia mesenterica TaxID=1095465 RepID=A0A4S4KZD0_9AGAM|nr:hypothetical protein EW146_g10223 [Bondarzewia mesenterica]
MLKFWQELTKLLGIQTRASTAYHPQSDGLTERTNQTLEIYLHAYCSYQQDDWVDYLPLGEFAFNNLINTSTNKAAFEVNFGFTPEFEPHITERHTVPAAADLTSRLDTIHTELHAELQHAQDLQATYHNKKSLPDPEFLPGQMVWLLHRNISTTRPSLKLNHRRLGPYCIIRKVGSAAYLLQLPSYLSHLHPVFHVSLLERYADPSDFHPHASPTPFDLSDNTSPSIHLLLDCRKIGHRFEYLARWNDRDASENAWIPLSDIPTTLNKLIEHFHRHHPRAPRPHIMEINKDYHSILQDSTDINSPHTPPPIIDESLLTRASVPTQVVRPLSPITQRVNLQREYFAPMSTTLRSGCISHPPSQPDASISP